MICASEGVKGKIKSMQMALCSDSNNYFFALIVAMSLFSCTEKKSASNDPVLNGFERLWYKKELCNQKLLLLDSLTSEYHQIKLCAKLVEKLSKNKSLSNLVVQMELNCRSLKNPEKVISGFSNANSITLDSIIGTKLDIDLTGLSKLIQLKISNSKINTIFKTYYLNENLEGIVISNCKIDSILDGIAGFVSLEDIIIRNVPDVKFCFSFEIFKHLNHLSIQNCGLTSIPESVSQCTNLEYLDFNDNKLSSLPDNLANLINLNGCFFMGNCFVDTPMVWKTMNNWVEYGRIDVNIKE